jgi:endonuclease G
MIQYDKPIKKKDLHCSPFVVFFNLIHEIDDIEILREICSHINFDDNPSFFRSVTDFLVKHGKNIGMCDALEMAQQIRQQDDSYLHSYKKVEQSIQLTMNRPAFIIRNDQIHDSIQTHWKKRIHLYKDHVLKAIPNVGRIEITGHPQYSWVGTGWLIFGTDIVVTNRHVANIFASKRDGFFEFNTDFLGNPLQVRIDFKEEHNVEEAHEFEIYEVIHMTENDEPDIALLRVKKRNSQGRKLPKGLLLSEISARPNEKVYVIGYPSAQSEKEMKIHGFVFKGISNVKRLAPGNIYPSGASPHIYMHDCTTWYGNSGSPIVNLKTGEVMAVHYARSSYKYKGVRANWAVSSTYLISLLKQVELKSKCKNAFSEVWCTME